MGCDIHSFAEVKNKSGKWKRVTKYIFKGDGKSPEPFGWRSYGLFGFLADVRNVSFVPCITNERRGWPDDTIELPEWGTHSDTWITLSELLNFNYDAVFEDRRGAKQITSGLIDCAADMGGGNGNKITFREFLGESFFVDLEILKTLGEPEDVRVVMSFDS